MKIKGSLLIVFGVFTVFFLSISAPLPPADPDIPYLTPVNESDLAALPVLQLQAALQNNAWHTLSEMFSEDSVRRNFLRFKIS